MHQNATAAGAAPGTPLARGLQLYPDPLAGFKGQEGRKIRESEEVGTGPPIG